jgi:hypothetical protein
MLVSRALTIPKILGGEARGRKKVRLATKWDRGGSLWQKKVSLALPPCSSRATVLTLPLASAKLGTSNLPAYTNHSLPPSCPSDFAPTLLHPSCDHPVIIYPALHCALRLSLSTPYGSASQFCSHQEEQAATRSRSSARDPHREAQTGRRPSKERAIASKRF